MVEFHPFPALPVIATGFEQMEGADDVGLNEVTRPRDGAIHMRLRSEVHDVGDVMLLHDTDDGVFITQVSLLENVARMRHPCEIFEMPGIRQAVEVHDLAHLGLLCHEANEVRPDETSSTCNEKVHILNQAALSPTRRTSPANPAR